jgi:hypothetical protein
MLTFRIFEKALLKQLIRHTLGSAA